MRTAHHPTLKKTSKPKKSRNIRNPQLLLVQAAAISLNLRNKDHIGDDMKILTVILVLLLATFFIAARRKTVATSGAPVPNAGSRVKKPRKTAQAPRNPYRATSILHDANSCDAVKTIGSRRFLDVDRATPTLPLPDCDAAQCNCKYTRHEDRRDSDHDRRIPSTLQADLYGQTGEVNRRARKRGRRKTDWD